MARATIAILSTENLLHNVRVIKKHAPDSRIMAMVKANAYGHGLRSTSLRLAPHVDSLGVASIDEALALRKIGIRIPITLMEGVFEPDELLVASCEGFHVVIHEATQLKWIQAAALPLPLTVWLKIDTGLGRLGFVLDEAERAYDLLSASKNVVQPIGLLSHFSCADEPQHPLNAKQIEVFRQFVSDRPGPKSLCNSAALFAFPDQQYDVVRPGIALYGITPSAQIVTQELGLKPVMQLQTRLIAVRMLPAGTPIGYGARYSCPERMPVGVVAMGYGDGALRTARDGMPVLVNGIRCPIIGRVSMDMITIDLRSSPHAQVGDQVVLWGEQLPIETIASFTSHAAYDMLTGVQSRVKFYWTLH